MRKAIYKRFTKEEVLEQGMEIHTTIDMHMQKAAEKGFCWRPSTASMKRS